MSVTGIQATDQGTAPVPESPEPAPRTKHYKAPVQHAFTSAQRAHTTVLFGGLTWNHERLIKGAWEGLGYKCDVLPCPDVEAFQLGKEYGNNGQCNPTYFTVGNLVQYLQGLEAKGLSRQEIKDKYVYITAGACGPCRFGMYEAEYRLALRNSGFEGFRVLLFQQGGGLNQVDVEAGLEMNLDFFLGLINAMNMGDMLNEIGYIIRPYEVEEGKTNEVMEDVREKLAQALLAHDRARTKGPLRSLLDKTGLLARGDSAAKFMQQYSSEYYIKALGETRERLGAIELDRFRVKPIVKITGEFWAQTTEGAGNFHMFPFLESEGAEVIVEPIGTWIMYMIHQVKQKTRDRRGLQDGQEWEVPWWRIDRYLAREWRFRTKMARMTLAERLFKRDYERLQEALGGGVLHELADQYHLQRVGHPYYNSRAGGGEGHLEVAKNIYYSSKGLCHMVLSVKPFGCMPSTQSDGAQAAVVEHYRDIIYLPIETSGEGEINAHSRVQMALGNARIKAREEFNNALSSTGRTLEELRAWVDENPQLKSPLYVVPKRVDVVGQAANFVLHVAELMSARGVQGARDANGVRQVA